MNTIPVYLVIRYLYSPVISQDYNAWQVSYKRDEGVVTQPGGGWVWGIVGYIVELAAHVKPQRL